MPIPRHRLILFLGLAGLALAGCTYSGGIDNPLVRKFEWFSYVAGDDIRSKCGPGSPPQYRLGLNPHWDEQVRASDLRQSFAPDGGALLFTHDLGRDTKASSRPLTDPPWPPRAPAGPAP